MSRPAPYLLLASMVMLGLGLSGCTRPQRPVAATRQATSTARADAPAAPPATRVATAEVAELTCSDDARYLEDLSVPDGTVVAGGEPLDKRWAVHNSGTCDWGPRYRLAPLGENPFTGDGEVALYPARAGAEAIWRVTVRAPREPGEYLGQWQAVNGAGERFGDSVFLLITVVAEEGGAETPPG